MGHLEKWLEVLRMFHAEPSDDYQANFIFIGGGDDVGLKGVINKLNDRGGCDHGALTFHRIVIILMTMFSE